MSRLFIFYFFAFYSMSLGAANYQLRHQEDVDMSTVTLYNHSKEPIGTGVTVVRDCVYVYTALHVVNELIQEDDWYCYVGRKNSKENWCVIAKVFLFFEDIDIALLVVKEDVKRFVTNTVFDFSKPRRGDEIWGFGNLLNYSRVGTAFFTGKFSSAFEDVVDKKGDVVLFDLVFASPITGGCSGAGVWRSYKCIGICVATAADSRSACYISPSRTIWKRLKEKNLEFLIEDTHLSPKLIINFNKSYYQSLYKYFKNS
ncbi:MAG: serine protease [Bacteroidales bacterium]